MKKIIASFSAIAAVLVFAVTVYAANQTVVVTGDTSAGENQPGWMFNRDASTSTPFEFTTNEASIGNGSLYVLPISSNPSDKFVAENFLATPVDEVDSISFDYLIAGNGDVDDSEQFYINVYTNIDDSNNFYDCRFDYVATGGSTTDFTTFTIESNDTPIDVVKRGNRLASCPETLAEMQDGSYIRAFSISVGDTSASDTGLAGYLDNVVVDTVSGVTTYDFEPFMVASNKNQCKDGGYMDVTDSNGNAFRNQGQCVSYVQANENAGK